MVFSANGWSHIPLIVRGYTVVYAEGMYQLPGRSAERDRNRAAARMDAMLERVGVKDPEVQRVFRSR